MVAALWAAGCAGAPGDAPGPGTSTTAGSTPGTRPPLVLPRVLGDVEVGMAVGGAEPNIAAAADGTLYVSTPALLWRSDDRGSKWDPQAAEKLTGLGDGDLAVDGRGNVYWFGLDIDDDNEVTLPFQVSTDRGQTFNEPFDVAEGTGEDREWLEVTPNGTVFTAWRGQPEPGGPRALEFRASKDGGATWLPKVVVGGDAAAGPIGRDPRSGLLYIPMVTFPGGPEQSSAPTGAVPFLAAQKPRLRVAVSEDEGLHWRFTDLFVFDYTLPLEPNSFASDFPVVAVDEGGTAYLVVTAHVQVPPVPGTPPEEVSRYGVYLLASHDEGRTWSAPRLLSPPDKAARFPWVAAGAAGRIAVTWYENVRGNPSESTPDQWNVLLWESVNADQKFVESVAVRLNADVVHTGPICTAGASCLVVDRRLLDFFEVTLTPDGQPCAAWAVTETPFVPTPTVPAPTDNVYVHATCVQGTPLR